MITGPRPVQLQNSGDIYQELGPNYSSQELLVTAALRTAMIPGDEIVAETRPPLPQIQPFPPRFGYPDYPDRQATIQQVLNADRTFGSRLYELSGGVAAVQGAARNVGIQEIW